MMSFKKHEGIYQIKNVSCSFEHLNDGSLKYYNLVLCRKIAIQCAVEVV